MLDNLSVIQEGLSEAVMIVDLAAGVLFKVHDTQWKRLRNPPEKELL